MKKRIQLLVLSLMLIIASITKAQNWQPLGPDDNNQPTYSGGTNINVKANHAGVVYMAYRDVNDYLRVRKNNGTQWVDVGAIVSVGAPGVPSLAFDTADIPYIAYPDFGYYQGCVNVKKFVGGNWIQVGTSCFSGSYPDNVHIAISSKDSVVVLWRDGNITNKTNVKKYDGIANWNFAGIPDFSGVATSSCDLAMDATDSIYVVYANASTNKGSVQKFSNNSWSLVGNADFSIGTTSSIKITTDANNNPLIAYANTAVGNQPFVMKWNGTNWNALGTMQTASAPYDMNATVLMMANGQPTFAYAEFYNGSISVQQYNGTSWSFLGTKYLTPLNYGTGYLGATSDNSGNIFMLYRDGANQSKITAKKYNGGTWTDFETRGLAVGYSTDVRTFVDYNGIAYICYSDVTNGYKACVKKFVGGSWVAVGTLDFSDDRADNFSMAFDKNSVPYVCYHDWAVNGSTIQKFNGTTWVTVGVKGITGRTAFVPYMSMDTATTTPYVISEDDNGHNYKAIVEKFDGTNWVVVGSTPNFSVGRVFNPKIVVTSAGVPYVTYADENINSQAVVKMFDGTNWVNVGAGIISTYFNTDYNSISLGKNDTVYVAYKDNQVTYKAYVQRFDGTNWKQLGPGVGTATKYISLANNAAGVPYIAFEEGGDGNKAYVQKYNKSDSSWKDVASTLGGVTSGTSDWVSLASNRTNNTFYLAYAYGDVYAKTIGLSITATAGVGGTITPSGSTDVASGTNKSFTIAANAGYCIQDVLVDGVSIGAATNYTFNNVTVSHSISASFVVQVTPSVTLVASPSNHICAGANVVFTATATNGGSSPNYNFKVNGNSVQNSSSNTFSSSSLNNDDVINCVLTANNFCQTQATDNSNTIRMTVDVSVTPSVSLMADNNNVCAGTNITFTTTATNGGSSPIYNFMVNGNSVQSSSSNTFSSSSLNNGDAVLCVLTANNICQTAPTAMSNNVNMSMIAYLTPSVSIASNSGLNICSGSNVIFTATPVNGGASPSYNFMVNGNSVQSSSSNTFNVSSLNNNDVISCIMSSNNVCQTTNNANSNNLVMTLTANATPTVSISTGLSNTICAGTNVVFTATPVNGGNTPTYQWKKNGNNVGSNSNTYADNALVNNDSVWCVLTSNSVCVVTTNATSNKIKFTVNSTPAIGTSTIAIATLCTIGSKTTVSNSNTNGGGIWSSSDSSVATVSTNNGANGVVTSLSNGAAMLTYTKTNVYGCVVTASTNVAVAQVATPNAISGINAVCKNSTTALSTSSVGGVWSSVSSSIASVNANTGLVSGNSPGVAQIRYSITNAKGCSAFASYNITVNAIPNVPTIAYAAGTPNPQTGPGGAFCANRTFTVVGNPSNGAWSSTGVLTVNPSTGVINTGAVAGAGSVTYTVTTNGCSNSRGVALNVAVCAGGRGVNAADNLSSTSSEFTMYPNPAKSIVSLSVKILTGAGSIVVTDLYGKQIKNQSMRLGINTVDVSSLAKGIYFVTMITNNEKSTKKLIVE